MRYIDLDLVYRRPEALPDIDAAEAARATILGSPDLDTRRKLIKDHRLLWVAFRPHFQAVFGAKCWYTESENPGTDDDIDHFRPKGRVDEDPTHEGYWWEALNWKNFRLSCHRANRGRHHPGTRSTHGKVDHFPLLVETDRWRRPADICVEQPALLDPTVPEDPPMLTFDQNGRVALAPHYEGDDIAARRVEHSRVYLHLDWPEFVEHRRNLYAGIRAKVMDGDEADKRYLGGDVAARETLRHVSRDLIRMAGDDARYSRAACAYIRHYRTRDWVTRFVLANVPPTLDRDNA